MSESVISPLRVTESEVGGGRGMEKQPVRLFGGKGAVGYTVLASSVDIAELHT